VNLELALERLLEMLLAWVLNYGTVLVVVNVVIVSLTRH
jgi:hypothetical protein